MFWANSRMKWKAFQYRVPHPNPDSHSTVHSTVRVQIWVRHPVRYGHVLFTLKIHTIIYYTNVKVSIQKTSFFPMNDFYKKCFYILKLNYFCAYFQNVSKTDTVSVRQTQKEFYAIVVGKVLLVYKTPIPQVRFHILTCEPQSGLPQYYESP